MYWLWKINLLFISRDTQRLHTVVVHNDRCPLPISLWALREQTTYRLGVVMWVKTWAGKKSFFWLLHFDTIDMKKKGSSRRELRNVKGLFSRQIPYGIAHSLANNKPNIFGCPICWNQWWSWYSSSINKKSLLYTHSLHFPSLHLFIYIYDHL